MKNRDRIRILVIDDDPAKHMPLNQLLSPEYEILSATDIQNGFESTRLHLPDLILLDISRPGLGLTGFDGLEKLKKSFETEDIPVILITEQNKEDDEFKSLALGAADYIKRPFNPETVKLKVRNQVKIITRVQGLTELITTDTLTRLPNNMNYEMQLQREWGRARREKTPLSVLRIGIDNFAAQNNQPTPQQMDEIINSVGKILTASLVRSTDFVAHLGQGEFVVLLPNVDFNGAVTISGKIRLNVAHMPITLPDSQNLIVTVSLGVNTQIPKRGSETEDFIILADKALASARSSGGNMAVCIIQNKP